MRRALFLLILLAWIPGCGGSARPSATEDAAQTARDMLALAEAERWDEYVDRFYGESHKFGSDADRRALIQRFQDQWGPTVRDGLRKAVTTAPVIVDERAEFRVDGKTVFVLHRAPNGSWSFHL